MTAIMTSDVIGQTLPGHDGLLDAVSPALQGARGFAMSASHPIESGWPLVEVRDSRKDAARVLATTIAPQLPETIRPKLTFTPLHDRLCR